MAKKRNLPVQREGLIHGSLSPWDEEAVRHAAQRALIDWMLAERHKYSADVPILLSLDDSLAKKLSEMTSEHRTEHLLKALDHFGQEALRRQSVDDSLRTLFPEIV